MNARVVRGRARLAVGLAVLVVVWIVLLPVPTQADTPSAASHHAAEPADVDVAASGSPSGAAGLSLLAAVVVATLWNVAVGERRARATNEV